MSDYTSLTVLSMFLVCFVDGSLTERDKMKWDTFQVMTEMTGLYSFRQPPTTVHTI